MPNGFMEEEIKWVFIDSNAFLTLYSYDYDPSPHLKKILKFLQGKKINLILTEQVVDEVGRNREKILGRFLKQLSDWKESTLKIPQFCKDIPPSKAIKNLSKGLYNKFLKQSREESLEVDKIFKEICENSNIIKISSDVINEARERQDRGNPPGKKGSYGDCINWEIILKKLPKRENLYFIGGDFDFSSDLDENTFSLFLSKEIENKKKSKVVYYSSISGFLKKEFEDKTITKEQIEKEKEASPKPKIYQPYHMPYLSRASFQPVDRTSFVSSGSEVFSGAAFIPANEFLGSYIETEIKCLKCDKKFHSAKYGVKVCPHCGFTTTPTQP